MSEDISISDFIPIYPIINPSRIESNNFYQDLYRKKEFFENKITEFDERQEKKKEKDEGYKPMKHQIIGSRYMSQFTPYDRLLVNHEMGTGKCVLPDTLVSYYKDDLLIQAPIDEIWQTYSDINNIEINSNELWSVPIIDLNVLSINKDTFNSKSLKVLHLFKQFINEDIVIIKTSNCELRMTKSHKVLTIDGWSNINNLKLNTSIATLIKSSIIYEPIKYLELKNYTGYVYDIEVEETHSYVANNIITHNTCYAVGIIKNLKSNDPSIQRALILSNSEKLYNNFKNELLFKCGVTRENLDMIETEDDDTNELDEKMDPETKRFYKFYTFTRLGKQLRALSDKEIHEKFSNSIIVLDEVHHLHTLGNAEEDAEEKKEKEKKKSQGEITYREIKRMLHVIENSRQILLTGTPMRNKPQEIVDIMNLILPLDNQLTYDYFAKIPNQENGYAIPKNKINEFKQYFKGIVTYLRADKSAVEVIQVPQFENLNNNFDIKWVTHNNLMSEFQSDIYRKAFSIDEMDVSGRCIYCNSVQAALYTCDPDKDWDKKIQKGDMPVLKQKTFLDGREKLLSQDEINLTNIRGKENVLNYLQEHSTTYFNVLKQILENPSQLCFIFCNLVKGSGLKTFVFFLGQLGFTRFSTKATKLSVDEIYKNYLKSPGKRYICTTKRRGKATGGGIKKLIGKGSGQSDEIYTSKQLSKLIEVFNDPRNKNGDYIQLIAGSQMISEGFSLKNIQQIHITTPYWNWSETSQAIARGLRAHSHDDLINDPSVPKINGRIQVRLFLHAAVPVKYPIENITPEKITNLPSIDSMRYQMSTQKDNGIQQVQNIIKETSFDCQLTYARNFDGNDYKCEGITQTSLNWDDLDYSTYRLLYMDNTLLKTEIKNIFKEVDTIDIVDMKKRLSEIFPLQDINNFVLYKTLYELITTNTVIPNRYTLGCYLKEFNNVYFLSPVTDISNNVLSNLISYYSRNPSVMKDRTQSVVFDRYYIDNLIHNIENYGLNLKVTDSFSPEIVEMFIEKSIMALDEKIDPDAEQNANTIIDTYKNFIRRYNNGSLIVSSYLQETKRGPLRCISKSTREWKDCDSKTLETIKKSQAEIKIEAPIVGVYKGKNKQFAIDFRIKETDDAKKDKRKQTRGRVCGTYFNDDLIVILVALKLGKRVPIDNLPDFPQMYENMKLDGTVKKDFNDLTDEEKELFAFWLMDETKKNVFKNKKNICGLIEETLRARKLIEQ